MKYLEDRIRNMICNITNSKYISALDVTYNNGIYVLTLGLSNRDAKPLSLGFQGTEEGFIKYLESEFKKRRLQEVQWNTVKIINGESPSHYPIIEL